MAPRKSMGLALVALLAVGAMALYAWSGHTMVPNAAADSGCEGNAKLEGSGTLTAPPGMSITGVCIKAGRNVFDFAPGDTGDGCYTLSWVQDGGCWVSVTTGGGGTGRDCKGISHIAVTWEPSDCKKDPPPKEDCKNGVDDDGDGLVDCEDGDCKDVCP